MQGDHYITESHPPSTLRRVTLSSIIVVLSIYTLCIKSIICITNSQFVHYHHYNTNSHYVHYNRRLAQTVTLTHSIYMFSYDH